MQPKNNHIHTIVLGSLDTPSDKSFESRRRGFSPAGIAPTCLTCGGGWYRAYGFGGIVINQ